MANVPEPAENAPVVETPMSIGRQLLQMYRGFDYMSKSKTVIGARPPGTKDEEYNPFLQQGRGFAANYGSTRELPFHKRMQMAKMLSEEYPERERPVLQTAVQISEKDEEVLDERKAADMEEMFDTWIVKRFNPYKDGYFRNRLFEWYPQFFENREKELLWRLGTEYTLSDLALKGIQSFKDLKRAFVAEQFMSDPNFSKLVGRIGVEPETPIAEYKKGWLLHTKVARDEYYSGKDFYKKSKKSIAPGLFGRGFERIGVAGPPPTGVAESPL